MVTPDNIDLLNEIVDELLSDVQELLMHAPPPVGPAKERVHELRRKLHQVRHPELYKAPRAVRFDFLDLRCAQAITSLNDALSELQGTKSPNVQRLLGSAKECATVAQSLVRRWAGTNDQ